jgi:hypothetical protein
VVANRIQDRGDSLIDMHKHPALGIVIAWLESREDDVDELLGIHAAQGPDEEDKFDVYEMEAAARDLVNFASWLALQAYSEGHPDSIAHEENPEHVAHTIGIIKDMAMHMPLVDVEGDDDDNG